MSVIQTNQFVVPSDPVTIKMIKDFCEEMSASMTRSEGERDFQKEAIKNLADETDVPAKYLKKVSSLFHKQNREEVEADQESTIEFYDKIFSQDQE